MNHIPSNRPVGQQRSDWKDFVNQSGEQIPAHAVLRIQGVEATKENSLKAYQPNGTTACDFALNAPRFVSSASGAGGVCTIAFGSWALYDDNGGDDDPQPGETWGPGDGDWLLHKNGTGFTILGGAETFVVGATTYYRVRVARATGSTAAGLFYTTEAISAASLSGDVLTVGSGTAKRFTHDSGDDWTKADAADVTIYNSVPAEVASGKIVQCKRIDGRWFVDVEPCD